MVVVHDHNYHGSVDETFASLDADGRVVAQQGQHRAAGRSGADDPGRAVQRHRRRSSGRWPTGEVAALLIEPALTNVGIVLPEPGYHDAVRDDHPRDAARS